MAVRRNKYEKQAMMSVVAAGGGGLFALAAVAFVLQAFDPGTFQVIYSPQGKRIIAILGSLGLALAGGLAGCLFGLTSAGQRTNTRNSLSWTGFFLSAAVITLTLSCGVFFYVTRFPQQVRQLATGGG